MSRTDWVQGDRFNLSIPAHAAALIEGGTTFLTTALRTAGALPADNRVAAITKFIEHAAGSTGRKVFLSVAYEKPTVALPTELFVKFSRDFDDPIRDRGKDQLEAEVQLALLSTTPGFPIAVPRCLFADYQRESGTGMLVTERISFGANGIEPHYGKCIDYEMPEPLEHYRALLTAVARLAGTHKAGALAANIAEQFPFDRQSAIASDRIRYSERQLLNRVSRLTQFAARHPQLFPANVVSPAFLAQLAIDVPRFLAQEVAIKTYLHSDLDFIALCHWNANVDNAWFWRNARGELQCGLMDWGRVGQMNMALALFGSLSAAEPSLWDSHLSDLLTLFTTELRNSGGPQLDPGELELHLMLVIAMMGLAWLMDAPALVEANVPHLDAIENRRDPRFKAIETARVQLHMLTTVLNVWETHRFGELLDTFLRSSAARASGQ